MLHRGAVQPYDRGAVQYQPDPQYSSYPKAVWLGDGLYWDNQQQSVLIGDGIFQSDGILTNRAYLTAGLPGPHSKESKPAYNTFYLISGLPESLSSFSNDIAGSINYAISITFTADGSLVEGDDGFVEAAILPIFQSKIFHSKVINVRGSLVGK